MILPPVGELLGRVARHGALDQSFDALRRKGGEVRVSGLTDPAKAVTAALAFAALGRPIVMVVESNQRAEALLEPLRYFYRAVTQKPGTRVVLLPSHEVTPYENRSPHAEISEDRAVALWRFASGDADILITPIQAAAWRMRDAEFYKKLALTVSRDQTIEDEELIEFLSSAGYDKQVTCDMPGQYAVRGGIVDIFSPETLQPVRLELLGDTIESIRAYDANTQRSTSPVERATLMPLTEYPLREELIAKMRAPVVGGDAHEGETPLALFPGWEFREALREERKCSVFDLAADPVIVMDEPSLIAAALEKYRTQLAEGFDKAEDPLAEPPNKFIFDDEEWALALELAPRFAVERLGLTEETAASAAARVMQTRATGKFHGNVPGFIAEARARIAAGENVMVSAASTGEMERLADICHEFELPYRMGEMEDSATLSRLAEESSQAPGSAMVLTKAPLTEGVIFDDAKVALYGNGDLFETLPAPSQRTRTRAKTSSFFSDFSDLKPGDFVVHVDHGIGQFEGLRQIAAEGAAGEFMLLKYADDAKVYVPLARIDLVQKYQSLGGVEPQLDRLGTTVWEARKTRVKKSVADMADQLLALYAERKLAVGHAFPGDTNFTREFADAFEFQETVDQAKAIEDVKRDMEGTLPMDRLLCGDVGYGKTEVAMRASFKAIADSKQVAVLAPTTVLAFQHFQTFKRRFAAFPVRIEMISRFRTEKEQKKVIADLEAGQVDILIGTHRLLSKDVKFQDLGLLVVDEEQRFGVAHKERLKEMRKNVDVLTMSATPIPRTLHMSLVGLRDMSVIETPPKDRLAIQTSVSPFSEPLVQRVIEEELAREGQVFFVHNRVESIASLASMVKRLVPKARVIVGHGQMKETELEKVMMQFIRNEANVLVSTTIVENGLDIPRANTIIINRADRMGLSELYQLRGRVGRSDRRAYAYLLIPQDTPLSGIARQRLAALKEFSDLGAGFRIAALDLELRGAGNLLGREQHGHIEAVGFDMYCQMMERAVAERKGEGVAVERRATLNLGQEIRIPPEYIDSENLRLRIYKRISSVTTDEGRKEVRRELEDRFGPPPPSVENLLDYAVLKALAEKLFVSNVDRRAEQVAIKFYEDTPLGPEKLVKLLRGKKGMRLDPTGVLWIDWKGYQGGPMGAVRNVLQQLQS